MPRISDGDPAERLDPFRKEINELELLSCVLVEEQMQLVEGRTRDDPMMLLVERVEDRCIGQDAIEELGALGARLRRQGDRQEPKSPEPLAPPVLAG
jgi:hypothetical protein